MPKESPSIGGGRIWKKAHSLSGAARDYDPLMDFIADSPLVLLGSATQGTHEFCRERALITRRLIEEKGFRAVAVEADFPDSYRVDRFVRGQSRDQHAGDALSDLRRFPRWNWRNTDALAFVRWLKTYNAGRPFADQVGFYGVDLYGLCASLETVFEFLGQADPEMARNMQESCSGFDQFKEEPVSARGPAKLPEPYLQELLKRLEERFKHTLEKVRPDDFAAPDGHFYLEQNQQLLNSAQDYYRAMLKDRVSCWNFRDQHMANILVALHQYLTKIKTPAKIVVWQNNSHIGDARATEMADRGEWNLGELIRKTYRRDAVLVGFTTYQGTVAAASVWGGEPEIKKLEPAVFESFEWIFHELEGSDFMLLLRDDPQTALEFQKPRLERCVGAVYIPELEKNRNYFCARLSDQFDALVHIDKSRAVEPLNGL